MASDARKPALRHWAPENHTVRGCDVRQPIVEEMIRQRRVTWPGEKAWHLVHLDNRDEKEEQDGAAGRDNSEPSSGLHVSKTARPLFTASASIAGFCSVLRGIQFAAPLGKMEVGGGKVDGSTSIRQCPPHCQKTGVVQHDQREGLER